MEWLPPVPMVLDRKGCSESEWFGLEGTFKGLVQPPCNEQGHLQLGQVAQGLVQPDLECFQGWGIFHLFGQGLVPGVQGVSNMGNVTRDDRGKGDDKHP